MEAERRRARRSCARAGIDPTEIGTVVMTHLHADHASGISEFPGATFVVSAQEWDGGVDGRRARRLRPAPVRPRLRLPHDRLRGRRRRLVRHASAARVDLFGDGSVRLVFTPGHTLGHCR